MPLFTSAPNSLCILRLSAIGDVCHAIAAVQAIQRAWPQTKITWITGKLEAQLLAHISNVQVIVFDKKQGLKAYTSLYKTLKNQRFDALLHMQSALRSSMVSLLIKSPIKIGFDKERAKDAQWLFSNQKIDKSNNPHVLDGFMGFVKKLGINDTDVQWNINIPLAATQKAKNIINGQKTFIICPATSKAYKNWTKEGYLALAKHALNLDYQVLICGANTQTEHDFARYIIDNTSPKCISLIGKTSLIELLATIQQSDLILAPDTGPTHMATMVATPVIGLYAHHNPKRTGPYGGLKNVISVYEQCIYHETGEKPDTLPWRARVKDENAMQQISTSDVIDLFNKIIQKK
ncbi:glycosyl transferase family protein [Psychromonas sp. CNPT3]|uniref:glycosyltransferase family 9 protein n=1 Tax=Psychromonas sp. CNPT3 TaxID=314282 RepID=UPI00006E5820|nr:glycosyltransferase family 9 protein [Psychromonas sp. CNPT3]AGH80466.1 glycosyl transferase family protein [Psychromonas sp. CNPT3]